MRFSIIIPVYNVENYLDECMRSVLSQSYADFEVILVDDKSPDNSPAICDRYAQADDRVKVVHKEENEGPAKARNTGIAMARGEYIVFVDSDDYLSPDTLLSYDKEITDGLDIFACGMQMFTENKKGKRCRLNVLLPEAYYADSLKGKAEIFASLSQNRVFPYVWNKAYRREFLVAEGIAFENTKLMEDFLFNIWAFSKAKSVKSSSSAFYYYRKPSHETLTTKYFPEFFEASKRKYQKEKAFLLKCNAEKYHDLIIEGFVKHMVSFAIRNKAKSANLSAKKQKQLIYAMMTDEVTMDALAGYAPNSLIYRWIKRLIDKKRVRLFYVTCSLIKAFRLA